MTKKKKIKIIKVVMIVVWLVLLFAPRITASMEDVELKSHEMEYNYNSGKYECTIVCDKSFVSGKAKIGLYNEYNTQIKTLEKEFEDNEGDKVVIIIEPSEVPSGVENYKIEELRVVTDTQEIISAVCYLSAIIMAVALIFVLRLVVLEYNLEGKQVEVFAGVRRKTMRINGELVAEQKKMFTLKPIVLTSQMGEKQVVAEIKANNKIVLYSKDINSKANEPEQKAEAYEMTEEEKDFFKQMEADGIIQKKSAETKIVLEVEEPAETVVDQPDGGEEAAKTETKPETTETKTDDKKED